MKYAFAVPILPGKTDAAREFINTVLGPKRSDWDELQKTQGVTEEHYFLQSSPEGDMIIFCGGGEWTTPETFLDLENNEFHKWFHQSAMEINGIDVRELGSNVPEKLGEWNAPVSADAPADN